MERGRAFSPDGHRLSERISGEFYGKPGEGSGFLFLFYIFLNLLTASVLYIAGAPINNTLWQLSQKGYIMVPYISGSK